MSQEWYVQTGGEILGPLDSEGVRGAVREGAIGPETMVRLGLEGRWHKAASVKGLLPPLPPQKPPITSLEITEEQVNETFRVSDAGVAKAAETLKKARKKGWLERIPEAVLGPDDRSPDERQKKRPASHPKFSGIVALICVAGWIFGAFFFSASTENKTIMGNIVMVLAAVAFLISTLIAVMHSCLTVLHEILNELRSRNAD